MVLVLWLERSREGRRLMAGQGGAWRRGRVVLLLLLPWDVARGWSSMRGTRWSLWRMSSCLSD